MLTLVGIAFFVAFVALGVWQVQRLSWKLNLIDRVSQRLAATPAPLPPKAQWPNVDAAGYEYQTVRVQGVWLPHKTVLTQASTELGPGYWVVTPLQLADGDQVLVNRGFVPQDQRAQWLSQPPAVAPNGTDVSTDKGSATVEGLLRLSEPGGGFLRHNNPSEQRWYSRDVAAIAQAQQLPNAAPFFVDAGIPSPRSAAFADQPQITQGAWPRPGLTIVRFTNTHLVYALTWFGLAVMVLGAAWLVARYEVRLRVASRAPIAHEPHP